MGVGCCHLFTPTLALPLKWGGNISEVVKQFYALRDYVNFFALRDYVIFCACATMQPFALARRRGSYFLPWGRSPHY